MRKLYFFSNITISCRNYMCISLTLTNGNTHLSIHFISFYNEGFAFKRRFLEMIMISLGIACLTFLIGFLV